MEPRLYSNKIESVDLRRCPCYHYLTKKVLSQWQMFIRVCPASWRESSWHIYGMNKLSQCHFVYTTTSLWSLILLLNSLMETWGNGTAITFVPTSVDCGVRWVCMQFICQEAGGSGIPEVIGFLNGTVMRHVLNLPAICVKFFSCSCAVGAGLPVGPEGPMIHIG